MANRFAGGNPQWGDDDLAWGDDLLEWGAPLSDIPIDSISRLKPEQVIVAACRSIQIPAYPVFQVGEPDVDNGSVVFASTGSLEQEGFNKTVTEQTFAITVRHKTYGRTILLTERVYNALRKFPGNRVRSITGFTDGYAEPDFSFRTRILQAVIHR